MGGIPTRLRAYVKARHLLSVFDDRSSNEARLDRFEGLKDLEEKARKGVFIATESEVASTDVQRELSVACCQCSCTQKKVGPWEPSTVRETVDGE